MLDVSVVAKAVEVVLGAPLDQIQQQAIAKYLARTDDFVLVDAIRAARPGWAAGEPDWYLDLTEGMFSALIAEPSPQLAP